MGRHHLSFILTTPRLKILYIYAKFTKLPFIFFSSSPLYHHHLSENPNPTPYPDTNPTRFGS